MENIGGEVLNWRGGRTDCGHTLTWKMGAKLMIMMMRAANAMTTTARLPKISSSTLNLSGVMQV